MKIAFCTLLLTLPALSYADMTVKCQNGIEFKAKTLAISRATDTSYMEKAMAVAVLLADGSVHAFSELIPPNVQCIITSDTVTANTSH